MEITSTKYKTLKYIDDSLVNNRQYYDQIKQEVHCQNLYLFIKQSSYVLKL